MGKGGAKKERGDGGERKEGLGLREGGRVGRGREGRRRGRKAGTILLGFQRRMTRAPCWNGHFISVSSVPASLVCCEHTWRQSFTKQTKEEAVWWPQGFRRSQDGQVDVLSHCGWLSVVGGGGSGP